METKTGNRVMKIQIDFSAMDPTIFELWVMETKLWVTKIEGVFGFWVSITHNSKIVGPMTQKLVWISITLFSIFVFITQFSDFLMMSYGNWKHILCIFSFHNSIFNGISIIKPTTWVPQLEQSHTSPPFATALFAKHILSLFVRSFFLSFFLLAFLISDP